MSLLARNAFRVLSRQGLRRSLATAAEAAESAGPTPKYLNETAELQKHASATSDMWRKISFYFCIPTTLVVVAWVRNVEAEHAGHEEHIRAENNGELPEPPAYEYLNRRVKPFPWGNNTLFFNPHVNKDMNEAE